MRVALACLLIACSWTQAQSSVIFSVQQASAGGIVTGSNAVFNVSVSSNAGTISNFAGVDFVIDAADPALAGNRVQAGQFVAGTSNFFPAAAGSFQLPFNPKSSFQVFSANNGAGLTLTAAPTLLATLTLNTAGATAGSYVMGLSQLAAVDPGFNSLGVVGPAVPLTYTIVAVPEPSTVLLLIGGVCMVGARRFLKKRKVA